MNVPINRRVTMGFWLAPIVAAVMWKAFAVLVIPVTYFLALVVGMPVFKLFYQRGWLQWWHAALGGVLAAAAFAAASFIIADRQHLEIAGPSNVATLLAYGAVVALLFWGIAIRGNPAFPHERSHWAMLGAFLIVLATSIFAYQSHLEISRDFGTVAAFKDPGRSEVSVRLEDGRIVAAASTSETASKVVIGRGVGMDSRLGAFSATRYYWLNGICRSETDGSAHISPC